MDTISPASLLYRWFGQDDFMAIASKYDILQNDPPYKYRDKIYKHFAELASTLDITHSWWMNMKLILDNVIFLVV